MRVSVVRYLVLVPLGLLVACSGGDPAVTAGGIEPIATGDVSTDAPVDADPASEAPAGEPEDRPAPEPDEVPDDPFVLDDPADVDIEYMDRVMAELLAVSNDVLDDVLASDRSEGLTEDDIARIRAVHSGPRLIHMVNESQRRATDPAIREAFLDAADRTGASWESERIVLADGGCIVAIGRYDVSGTAVVPYPEDRFNVVVVASMDPAVTVEHAEFNRTPWRIHELVPLTYNDSGDPVPRSEWPHLEYGQVLDLPCVTELA